MKLFNNINFNKLKDGLNKTRTNLFNKINETISGKALLDNELLDKIEEILVLSDIGAELAQNIIDKTRKSLKSDDDRTKENVLRILREETKNILLSYDKNNVNTGIDKYKPYVILVVGVNGAGKTTTIGKLAHNYKSAGLKVVIGSADTFRAAANEQLEIWAGRAGVEIVQSVSGNDPSSVAFDTLYRAKSINADIVIIDTAGRLHTKTNLMSELEKINRVLGKVLDYAPNETFLVLDGNTGQNAIIQAREFSNYAKLTGLIVTKLDGTARGGIVLKIISELKIPLKYIGVGEGINDLQNFSADEFINALFSGQDNL
ncbi:MAG: signal recognition particle-docking protein FtsY [Ignavibacteria bacterium]|nr:signal recognition particle-docking protein FtsY [Ignavibacteria bacterium]